MTRSARLIVLLVIALAVPVVASGATTTGSWFAYPGQSTVYKTQVQQPINADGSSIFANDSKSVIPVKFALLSGLGPFVFESICSDNALAFRATCGGPSNTANDFSFLSFTPAAPTTFDQITTLVANYTFTLGDCHGGSLRWSVRTSSTQSLFIYYGTPPADGNGGVGGCTPTSLGGGDQSGTNMIGLSDLRYDTSQYQPGTFYNTYTNARALMGTQPIIRASLVLDSGWGGDQQLTLASATVNDNTFTPSPATPLTKTCKLPPAAIKVTKTSGTPPLGVVNMPISVQPPDTNGQFRIVDCKYMYNLAVSSLSGPGTYKVEAVINNQTVDGAADFSLK